VSLIFVKVLWSEVLVAAISSAVAFADDVANDDYDDDEGKQWNLESRATKTNLTTASKAASYMSRISNEVKVQISSVSSWVGPRVCCKKLLQIGL